MRKEFMAIATMAGVIWCLTISCQKQQVVQNDETPINFLSPSGVRIAASMGDLKKEAAVVITKKYGVLKEATITGVEYLQADKGYAAIINYILGDGTIGNFAMISGGKYKLPSGEVTEVAGKVSILCVQMGPCDCFIRATIDAETGVITYSCSCGTCIPLIIQS